MPVILYQDNGQPASAPRHPHTMNPTVIFFFVCCTLALPINAAPNAQPVLPPPDPTTQPSTNPAIQVDLQAVLATRLPDGASPHPPRPRLPRHDRRTRPGLQPLGAPQPRNQRNGDNHPD